MKKYLLPLALILSLTACGEKGDAPTTTPTPTPPAKVELQLTPEQQKVEDDKLVSALLDSILREWSATDACYDMTSKSFLINIAPHPHKEGYYDQGWKFMEHYTFVELQNGSYVLKSKDEAIPVAPDITGLTCKHQPASSTWFQD